ncbi:MAG: hypothetical protein IKT34_04340 [Clostridia bacterium]|nr:hypothetical protein [Clostridia bacterium]
MYTDIINQKDNMNFNLDKNNKILASYLKKRGIEDEEIEKFLRLNYIREQWQKLADIASKYDSFDSETRKSIDENCLSIEKYGEIVAVAYDFFLENTSGATVSKDLLLLYSAINTVANSNFGGGQPHVTAIASALCEMLEYDNDFPKSRELIMYLKGNSQFEEGFFSYDIDNRAFVFIGADRQ